MGTKTKGIYLAWIVVNDFKSAIKFYTEVLGMEVKDLNEEFGWAELAGQGSEGARLGIAQSDGHNDVLPGQNAVVTMTVDHLDTSIAEFKKKGVKLIGDVMDIPGHVKMQLCQDKDSNHFQIVEMY